MKRLIATKFKALAVLLLMRFSSFAIPLLSVQLVCGLPKLTHRPLVLWHGLGWRSSHLAVLGV